MNERKCILSMIATKTSLTLESHVKRKPVKFVKKLFIPVKEYPTYNFIGLILGPKGNTQKKMEKETGAKILLRGKGSGEPDPLEEELHVLVEADNQGALSAAVAMIEKLLVPVADQENDHKRAQLAELAKMRGTYKDNNTCDLCKEQGHKKYACPLQDSTFKAVCCDICGSFGHSTLNCSMSISHHISKTLQGSSGVAFDTKDKSNKEVDPANLYVGYLPQAIDEKRLKELFLPLGKILKTTVVRDQSTGLSKGYGFVKFESPSDAAAAVTYMYGYKMDGQMLAVRIAGQKPGPDSLNSGHVPIPSSHIAVPFNNISGQTPSIYGPVIPMPPEAPFSTMNNESLCFPWTSSYFGQNINVPRTEAVNIPPYVLSSSTNPRLASKFSSDYDFCDRIPVSLPNLISQFPGHPDYPGSQFKSYFSQQ
ncbi:putative RNA-binding protein SEB4 (RRM superfamily) [Handroanthus impetiginosus]|uniref:Branchpoint-bridging protein n=1 Tax=Handroanthus impetiginosus TaxID=429701 RepID=A0A2G9H0G3_9LAMI|nr:putative RNA-binding protein SEB4 (RRM superfamily) [Handroanthus impetiginosus]